MFAPICVLGVGGELHHLPTCNIQRFVPAEESADVIRTGKEAGVHGWIFLME